MTTVTKKSNLSAQHRSRLFQSITSLVEAAFCTGNSFFPSLFLPSWTKARHPRGGERGESSTTPQGRPAGEEFQPKGVAVENKIQLNSCAARAHYSAKALRLLLLMSSDSPEVNVSVVMKHGAADLAARYARRSLLLECATC